MLKDYIDYDKVGIEVRLIGGDVDETSLGYLLSKTINGSFDQLSIVLEIPINTPC